MSKRLVLVFCALFVMAACVPAFAAVQNIKVSGDILTRMINRNDFDLIQGDSGGPADAEDEISVFNSVVRVRIDAELTDNVSAVVRLINERNWDENTVSSSDIDLDLAFVTMKEFLYEPLTIAIGRQELHFGNDMLIGDGVGTDPNGIVVSSGGIGGNQTTNYVEATGFGGVNGDLAYRKAFDALRATLDYDPLIIDIIYAKIDENGITGTSTHDDTNLYGINAGYQFDDKWNTSAEAYWWNKDVDNDTVTTNDKNDRTTTFGGRVSTNPTQKLNLQQEVAWQGGHKVDAAGVSRNRNAWASQSMVTMVPGWRHEPVFGMVYSYFSGDADPANVQGTTSNKAYYAWDPMFENQTAGRIINALFPQWNAHNVDIMMILKPDFIDDVTLRVDWVYQALAKANNANAVLANDYSAAGSLSYAANKKEIGQEIDVTLTYDYTEDVMFELCADWFMPGRALSTRLEQDEVANEIIASCKVEF